NVTRLTWLTVGLVALSGFVIGIAPSSFPLLAIAAGMAAGKQEAPHVEQRLRGFWLSAGFALGIATVDALLGALFGFAGFAVLRVLASVLALVYALLGVILAVTGLALLRVIHVVIPVLAPSPQPARTFLAMHLL